MKKILYILIMAFIGFSTSCTEEELDESIFDTSEPQRNEFDKWLLSNYVYPYNIDLKYRMEDIESDMNYELVPADLGNAVRLSKLVKYLWLEAYDEVAGVDFTRTYVPKIIHLVGSPAYQSNGSITLGTAEGGLKVTLYLVNWLEIDIDFLNYFYFKTMHHEFGHILHQTKKFDPDFQKISDGHYVGGDWVNKSLSFALSEGFISPYSMNEVNEDFVEIIATFVTNTQAYWDDLLKTAGANGATIINQKFDVVQKYMKNSWNIDIYELRDVVQRRSSDIYSINWDNL